MHGLRGQMEITHWPIMCANGAEFAAIQLQLWLWLLLSVLLRYHTSTHDDAEISRYSCSHQSGHGLAVCFHWFAFKKKTETRKEVFPQLRTAWSTARRQTLFSNIQHNRAWINVEIIFSNNKERVSVEKLHNVPQISSFFFFNFYLISPN